MWLPSVTFVITLIMLYIVFGSEHTTNVMWTYCGELCLPAVGVVRLLRLMTVMWAYAVSHNSQVGIPEMAVME